MNKLKDIRSLSVKCCAGMLALTVLTANSADIPTITSSSALTFEKAIKSAQKNDPI